MQNIQRLLLTMVAGLLLGFSVIACGSQPQSQPQSQPVQSQPQGSMGMNHAAAGHTTTDPKAPFDQQFIDMMAPHHEGAVAMAKVAQSRAEHPEIRQLADGIVSSQDKEIQQMKSWRKAWYGSDQTPAMANMPMLPEMSSSMGNMAEDVQKLQTASPFDKAFIDAMIPHHESAIEAAKIAQQKATKPEIKQLAADIIAAQEKEIGQMREWRNKWYPG